MVQYGLGKHIGCVLPTHLFQLSKLLIVGEVLLVFSTLFSRVSICLFLLRLFTVNRSWRWVLYTIIGLTTAVNVVLAATNVSQCKPRAKLWNPTLPGKCWDDEVILGIAYFQGAVSVVLDLLLSAFPIYCLWTIQMSLRIKAAICGIMSLGVVTACACLVRTIFSDRIISADFTWDVVVPTIWGHVEAEVAICAACIATLRPLFSRESGKSKRGALSKRSTYTQYSGTSQSLTKWPGARAKETSGSQSTTVTSAPGQDEEVALEKLYGIKRVVDIDVTV
ncbi:hypothetical protein ACLMJK_006150 [Lecanora helva]